MGAVSRARIPGEPAFKISHEIAARGSEFPRVSSASSGLMRDQPARRRSPTQLSRQPESRDPGIAKQLPIRATDAAARANGQRNGKENR